MGTTNCCSTHREEDPNKNSLPKSLASGLPDSSSQITNFKIDLQYLEFKQTMKGTMGSDYEAIHTETGQKYMLKKIKMKIIQDLGLAMNKQINFELSSPYVVKVFTAFQENDCLHIFTQYVEGMNLFRKIFKSSQLSEELARFFISEIIVGLQYLHANKVIYRNLSPERIIIDKEGHIKLCNFGISQIFKWPKQSKMGTMSEAVDYKSPEQARGQDLTFYSDLWQLGMLLWHMITGVSPFRNRDRDVMINNILQAPIVIQKRTMSLEARDLILKLLVRNPQNRLGAVEYGFKQIKEHKFFQQVNWSEVETKAVKPPPQAKQQKKGGINTF